jgi:hypothetical protein
VLFRSYNGSITAPLLAEVGGYVWADNGSITAPLLAEVGGYVRADNGSKLDLPLLAEVGGDVWADNGSITAPLLAEVGGYVRAYNGSKIKLADNHKSNMGDSLRSRILSKVMASFKRKGYLFADNILARIISKRKQGAVTVYKTSKIGNHKKIVYVVQRGDVFSHGETVKQAIHDLRYKLDNNRDTTKYKKWTLDSVHPIADMIQAYRAITGACETGTKQWCYGKKLPSKVSVKVAIRITREAYGGKKFAEFFKKDVTL